MIIREDPHRICDRCGDEINLNYAARFHVERPLVNGSLIRRDKHPGEGRPFPVLEFDLCTRCADEFVEWLKQRHETSETTEEKPDTDKDNSITDKIIHGISGTLMWLSSALVVVGLILVFTGSLKWAETLYFVEWIAIGILVAITGVAEIKNDWKKRHENNEV